ncbi:MAG: ATP-binding protein [Myxococcota bacterium]|nr:ATP-binding protein [Myxococcota bacterium]
MDAFQHTLTASLSDLLDGSTLPDVCETYFNLFDVPIRVFDQHGNLLAEAVHPHPPCLNISQIESGRALCTKTRLKIKNTVPTDHRSLHTIDCFCGLRYSGAPIAYQGDLLGKIVLGPYLPLEQKQVPDAVTGLGPNVDMDPLRERLGTLRPVSSRAIQRIAKAILSVFDAILFSAHKAYVTSQMHLASVRESYRELTEKNRALEEMHEQMQAFERLKSNFLATISHELRTPLTSIIGYSEMLAEGIAGELAEEQQQFVQTIKTKGDELLQLISAILDFSRVETGHLDIHRVETAPKPLIEAAITAAGPLAERRGIRLSKDLESDLPAVAIDPEKVGTALSHLIENAIKFSAPSGAVRVSAATCVPDLAEGTDDGFGFVLLAAPKVLEIAVEDYGIGIPEGEQGQIFAPFTQLDNSSTREHSGAGLGLAIVKHYVEAHGGQVIVSSRVGQGSRFSIRIPIIDPE